MADFTLWHGDCLEEMSRIESGSVDAVICDLPYNVTNCHWDVLIPFEPLWAHYKRVIKKRGAIVLFGSQPFTTLLIASNFGWFKYEWVWDKNRATGGAVADIRPMKAHENILVFCEGSCQYNPQMEQWTPEKIKRMGTKDYIGNPKSALMYRPHIVKGKETRLKDGKHPTSVLRIPALGSIAIRLHTNEKPVALLSYLIKTYTNEGDTILDNTCGSGSTLEAAMRCKRNSIGIEKDAHYYQVASQRLARVAAELRGELNHLPMFSQ